MDEDGFIMAELNGRTGYIPSNLVMEVTDEDELSRINVLLQDQKLRYVNGSNQQRVEFPAGTEDGPHKMKACFDYDPAQDSPNENSEVELAITEGDIVTVFGRPDEDGYVQVCIPLKVSTWHVAVVFLIILSGISFMAQFW